MPSPPLAPLLPSACPPFLPSPSSPLLNAPASPPPPPSPSSHNTTLHHAPDPTVPTPFRPLSHQPPTTPTTIILHPTPSAATPPTAATPFILTLTTHSRYLHTPPSRHQPAATATSHYSYHLRPQTPPTSHLQQQHSHLQTFPPSLTHGSTKQHRHHHLLLLPHSPHLQPQPPAQICDTDHRPLLPCISYSRPDLLFLLPSSSHQRPHRHSPPPSINTIPPLSTTAATSPPPSPRHHHQNQLPHQPNIPTAINSPSLSPASINRAT